MKSNIVIAVVVLTLFIWIPAAWIVGTVDSVRENKWKEREMSKNDFANHFVLYRKAPHLCQPDGTQMNARQVLSKGSTRYSVF